MSGLLAYHPQGEDIRVGRFAVGRGTALVMVLVTYIVAALAFVAVTRSRDWGDRILAILLGNIAATLVVFLASAVVDNSSMYDPYWSVAPPLMLLSFYLGPAEAPPLSPLVMLFFAVVIVWGLRLTGNWIRGWQGLHHEDWRYRQFRFKTGKAYWPASLFGIHLFPTAIVFVALWPAFFAAAGSVSHSGAVLAGVILSALAVTLEATSDVQLHRHRDAGTSGPIRSGVWRVTRHPNYLGEVSFWWGVWLVGIGCGAPLWTVAGPLAMSILFSAYSIPAMEARLRSRRPDYDQVRAEVPRFLPVVGRRADPESSH